MSTAASTRLNAWSGVHRRGNPTRTRSRARPGTLEAQSPAVTTPTFTLKGLATSLNAGSSSPALISSSNSASARRIAGTQRTGFTARSAASAWAGTPVISISIHSTPTPPSSKVRSVGSSTTTASPSTPAFPAASVPLPVHSSSITDRNDSSPASASGMTSRRAARASRPIANPPFMSPEPRPMSHPSARTGVNGSDDQISASAGTTSMCPFSSSDGDRPGLIRPSTLSRPA